MANLLTAGAPKDRTIFSVSRALMFPNGSALPPSQQADAARKLRDEWRMVTTTLDRAL